MAPDHRHERHLLHSKNHSILFISLEVLGIKFHVSESDVFKAFIKKNALLHGVPLEAVSSGHKT